MRILFIANHLNVGGISSYLLTLSGGLIKRGHRIYLASGGGELEDEFRREGVSLFRVPLKTKNEVSPAVFFSFLKLKRIIRELNIDLIHSQSRTTQVLGELLGRFSGKPHIFTCHGFFRPRLFRRIFGCWGRKVIAVSPQVQEHLVSVFRLDPGRIALIPNGIDLERFGDFSLRQKMRREMGLEDNLLIGIVARLSDVKGHLYLIRAMPEVLAGFPGARLLIAGEGKMRPLLDREIDALALGGKVIFIPRVKPSGDLLAAIDVFAMPSLQEGLGLALMEAMAQGLAVVGSSVGGIKMLIQDKVNGLLVAPADVPGLARAIVELLGDEDLRSSLGKRAREFITANFSKEKMAADTELVYRPFFGGSNQER
ncbi:MAG: glycosyltransferase family 4 protein [Candidatus Omnitrophica bacterium]|nr:glycosyltransferase family 4 protein [Candidatus Omnitrophota bacterium]